MTDGVVYWITGLAGSGKTTIARELHSRISAIKPNVVLLDGDALRTLFGGDAGYTLEERKKLALTYARLCGMLSRQGIDVICATISLFHEVHEYNRTHIPKYLEIFIECNMKELVRRDQKGLYSRKQANEQVMGVDLPHDSPLNPDLIIENSTPDRLSEKVETILQLQI